MCEKDPMEDGICIKRKDALLLSAKARSALNYAGQLDTLLEALLNSPRIARPEDAPTKREIIRNLLFRHRAARDWVLDAAKSCGGPPYEFSPEECPLIDSRVPPDSHYFASCELFGTGCHMWNCGFCGQHFET